MTREEAIETLKDRIEQYTGGVHPGEREILLEAFDALRDSGWLDTATDKPATAHETVIVLDAHGNVYTAPGWIVRDFPGTHPRWMHLPASSKMSGSDARKAPDAEEAEG